MKMEKGKTIQLEMAMEMEQKTGIGKKKKVNGPSIYIYRILLTPTNIFLSKKKNFFAGVKKWFQPNNVIK